jgi:hypothetical protein
MRYVDALLNEMPAGFNLAGYEVVEQLIPKVGAYDTIDNVTKFALDDGDYELACVCYEPDEAVAYEQAQAAAQADAEMEQTINDLILTELYETLNQQAAKIAELESALGGGE